MKVQHIMLWTIHCRLNTYLFILIIENGLTVPFFMNFLCSFFSSFKIVLHSFAPLQLAYLILNILFFMDCVCFLHVCNCFQMRQHLLTIPLWVSNVFKLDVSVASTQLFMISHIFCTSAAVQTFLMIFIFTNKKPELVYLILLHFLQLSSSCLFPHFFAPLPLVIPDINHSFLHGFLLLFFSFFMIFPHILQQFFMTFPQFLHLCSWFT